MKTSFMIDSPSICHGEFMAGTFIDRDPPRAAAAHLLRRTAMSVHPERVSQLADQSWNDAVGSILEQKPDTATVPISDEWTDTTSWWLGRMTTPDTGLQDRMAWFWHGLLTTNAWKANGSELVGEQLQLLRDNALGDFRTLLHLIVGSGAMLEYLDASGSQASSPNENLARELMELFTIGRGNYTQEDVRAAARALAGWVVEDGVVEFRRENAFVAPLIFLGQQDDWDTTKVIDRLCDHPLTASRISARLWQHLVGTELDEASADQLGQFWIGQDLQILPLIERILTGAEFETSRLNKPRSGLEWYCSVHAILGVDEHNVWQLEHLGQMPYLPPNVAGWPNDLRWLSPGSLLGRASYTHAVGLEEAVGTDPLTVDQLLDRCSLYAVSDGTRQAIESIRPSDELYAEAANFARWRLALTCPEFNIS